jgi:cytochrome oxidase Cu insertion factor (SCO1/SenC/PrrC family)
MLRRRHVTAFVIGIACFAVAAVAARYLWPPSDRVHTVRSTGRALIGGPFALIDQTGKRRTDMDFRGRLMLVFFGFSHCADVCPTTLRTISETLRKLGDDAAKVRPLFITIDPDRDTVARLARYHKAFDPRIVMLTGSAKAIAAAAKVYRVYYAKLPAKDGSGDYDMAHSSFVYLMGRDGGYLAHFTSKITSDKLAAAIRAHL